MKIYQVCNYSTAVSVCFKTKKGAKKYIKHLYEEYAEIEVRKPMSFENFIVDQGIEINKIPLNK